MTEEQFKLLQGMLEELLTRVKGPLANPTPPVVPVPPVPPQEVPLGFVMTPRGRMFPVPKPELGEMFVGYTTRVGEYFGGAVRQQALNTAGALFITATPLFNKFGGFRADGANWPAAAEEHLFGDPNFVPDPRWGFSPQPR